MGVIKFIKNLFGFGKKEQKVKPSLKIGEDVHSTRIAELIKKLGEGAYEVKPVKKDNIGDVLDKMFKDVKDSPNPNMWTSSSSSIDDSGLDDIIKNLRNTFGEMESRGFDEGDDVKGIKKLLSSFGKPTKVEYSEDNGVYTKKSTWNSNGVEATEVIISKVPFTENVSEDETLEGLKMKLENAVYIQDYEEAARLRDQIIEFEGKEEEK